MTALADEMRLREEHGSAWQRTLQVVILVAGVMLGAGYLLDSTPSGRRFFFAVLLGWTWALSITLGALFWNVIHHLTGAGWSVGIRRIFENITRVIPGLMMTFIIILLGLDTVYAWTHADDLHHGKGVWLSRPAFAIRFVIYFAIWFGYSSYLRNRSLRMEHASVDERTTLLRSCERLAPSGVLLLGLTATFAAFDLIMSLNYHWFSTIFGVIFWADSIRASLALCILIVIGLHSAGYLRSTITREHFHDLGKLTFGFTVFWAYVAFSQYFLYWYGNIPEETKWYHDRRVGSWYTMSMLLPICYFAVPFVLLLPRGNKRNPRTLGFAAAWIVVFHLFHFYWQIMPEVAKTHVTDRPTTGVEIHWMDVVSVVFFAALMGERMVSGFRHAPLVPLGDPRLPESVHHEVDEFGDEK